MKETFKEAGYQFIRKLDRYGSYVVRNLHTNENEVWVARKNHASYGLIYKNTHLEFCYSIGQNTQG